MSIGKYSWSLTENCIKYPYMKDDLKFLMQSLPYILFVVLMVSIFPIIYSNTMVNGAENLDRYWSVLTGGQRVPPVITDARGLVGLKFLDNFSKLVYIVNVENMGNVTGINISEGDKNQNGTVVLDLLNGTRELKKRVDRMLDVSPEGKNTGTISIGGASKDDLQGLLKGKSISDFHNLIVNGDIFITVNTKDYPQGEIRGNSFIGIDRLFPDFPDIKWH